MLFRIILFCLIFIAALFAHPLVLAPLVFFYAMHWYALETMILAALIDSYFHTVGHYPAYTIGAFVIFIAAEIIKRYLRFV